MGGPPPLRPGMRPGMMPMGPLMGVGMMGGPPGAGGMGPMRGGPMMGPMGMDPGFVGNMNAMMQVHQSLITRFILACVCRTAPA